MVGRARSGACCRCCIVINIGGGTRGPSSNARMVLAGGLRHGVPRSGSGPMIEWLEDDQHWFWFVVGLYGATFGAAAACWVLWGLP